MYKLLVLTLQCIKKLTFVEFKVRKLMMAFSPLSWKEGGGVETLSLHLP
jgi:hypothetical protein